MKITRSLAGLSLVALLVACGGGENRSVAISSPATSIELPAQFDGVRPTMQATAAASSMPSDALTVLNMYQSLYGKAPSYADLTAFRTQLAAGQSQFLQSIANNFLAASDTDMAKLVLDNLGINAISVNANSYAVLLDAVGQFFGGYGRASRGQIILNLSNILTTLGSDETYGIAAVKFNSQIDFNYNYSINPTNTTSSPYNIPVPLVTSSKGLFNGATTTGRSVTGVVLGDGTYYVLYSSTTNKNIIAGVVQGNGTSASNSFTSSNAKDFNLEGMGILNATVAANFVTKTSLGGTITYSAPGITGTSFTATYNADFEVTPSLSTIAGTYTGQSVISVGSEAATVTISATGALSGFGASGCSLTGTVSPRSDGNVYDFSMRFGSTNCFFANQIFTGIGYYDSVNKKLIAAAPNATRTDGALFVGTKPTVTPVITSVSALKSSFDRAACRSASGTGYFSSLVEYKACGPAVVGDFQLTFGSCVLRKTGASVTLSTSVGTTNSITATLDQTLSGSNVFAGDVVDIGYPDPNYFAGSDESFNIFVGDFVSYTYLSINLRTDGRNIRSLSGQDFFSNKTIGCGS